MTAKKAVGRRLLSARVAWGRSAAALPVLAALLACAPEPQDDVAAALTRLRWIEQAERDAADFARQPPARAVMGAEPYALESLGDGAVGILRGADALVWLDIDGRETRRAAAPTEPTGLAVEGEHVFVVGRGEPALWHYADDDVEVLPLPAVGLRDVAARDGALDAVDEVTDTLFHVAAPAGEVERIPTCAGPIRVVVSERWLGVVCLIDHALAIHDRTSLAHVATVSHDGPIWGAAIAGDRVLVVGVEDAPLDRSDGFFGNIDSYAFGYRITHDAVSVQGSPLNLSAHGVVTPKAIAWLDDDRILVTGYGGERAAIVRWSALAGAGVERSFALPPGSNDLARVGDRWLAANPLLDGWWVDVLGAGELSPVAGPRHPTQPELVWLGEVMAFTTLMAPNNESEGSHSRFTCETCHFEGYVDGRTHHTGRGDVHATTKPLRGLFNNRPHFSRALDRDLTQVSHAEFRVAGAGNGTGPWYALSLADHAWLEHVADQDRYPPEMLREALLRFLMAYTHADNPRPPAPTARGAALFQRHCVSCHAARLSTDDASSTVPARDWQALRGAIVWASPEYQRVGVEPYVHERGARTPSLRRLDLKRPYFTNGSARSLEDVLARVRVSGDELWHDEAPSRARPLAPEAQRELAAWLRTL